MAAIYLQNKKGKYIKYNTLITLLILLFQGRNSHVDWILSNWGYCSNAFIKIPYGKMNGIDISQSKGR